MLEGWKFLRDVGKLIAFIDKSEFTALGGELQRSDEEQQRKYDAGVSKAKPGQSQHQKLKAIDIEFFLGGKWIKTPMRGDFSTEREYLDARVDHKRQMQDIGEYWEGLDSKNAWGGNFVSIYDPNHFERMD